MKIVSAPYAQTRDGEEVVLKGATDIMYAGEYGIKFSGKDPATVNEPINEYRDIGNSINVTPKVSDSGDFIELEVILDAADGEMDWQDYKVSLPSSDDDTTTTLLIRQPVFPDKSCNVKLTVAPGNIVVLGGECKLLDPESFTLVFLSSRLIKAKGLDKETPGDGSLVAYSSKAL